MGMCKPSGGIIKRIGRIGSLKKTGLPNTREDLYDQNGNLLQQRWYGPDGRAIWDRDWSHGGGKHEFPHDHYWIWIDPLHPDRFEYHGINGELVNDIYN